MHQFVPLTDDLLYEHWELLSGHLVPFSLDYPCYRWERPEEGPAEGDRDAH